jgi:hypothetical protein
MRWRATRLNSKGLTLEEKGCHAEAERLYLQAIDADQSWSIPWYNLGLLTKRQHRWQESVRFNQEALTRDASDEAAWWNLGIASTAIGNWDEARRAWRRFGIEIPAGNGPLDLDLGWTPIRVNPMDGGEVVWAHRIDPARARLRSVPFSDSGRCFDDLILHDGAPNGHRIVDGQQYSVFDEIELLTPSRFSTYAVTCRVSEPADTEALEELASKRNLCAEDWSRSITILCKECSEGIPHKHHSNEGKPWDVERRIGVAAERDEDVRALLDHWSDSRSGVEILDVAVELDAMAR